MSFDTLHKKNIIAKPNFNRWLVPPVLQHLCIGSVAWSMFNPALKILGVVTSSADDGVWISCLIFCAIVSLG